MDFRTPSPPPHFTQPRLPKPSLSIFFCCMWRGLDDDRGSPREMPSSSQWFKSIGCKEVRFLSIWYFFLYARRPWSIHVFSPAAGFQFIADEAGSIWGLSLPLKVALLPLADSLHLKKPFYFHYGVGYSFLKSVHVAAFSPELLISLWFSPQPAPSEGTNFLKMKFFF